MGNRTENLMQQNCPCRCSIFMSDRESYHHPICMKSDGKSDRESDGKCMCKINSQIIVFSIPGIGNSMPHNPHSHISKVLPESHLARIGCQRWLFSMQLIKLIKPLVF
jgi:hypothetical protein